MKNLQKLSGYLKLTFQFLAFFIPILVTVLWLFIDWAPINKAISQEYFLAPIKTPEGIVNFATVELTSLSKFIGCIGQLLSILPYILGFILLKSLFSAYQKNKIFTSTNTQIYKKIGWLAFLNGIFILPVTQVFMTIAATLSNPPGHRYICISCGTPHFEAILCGLLIIVISLVMQEAQSLQEENQLTV